MASPFDAKHSAVRARIIHYADMYGIDRNVAIWQIWKESTFNPRAQSHAGARGIAQFMPATARRFGVNVWDIESSLNGWGKYMSWLLRQPYINGRIEFALAGYNAGEGRVKQYKGIPPFAETKDYVATIMRNAGKPAITTTTAATTAAKFSAPSSITGGLGTAAIVGLAAVAALVLFDD